MQTLSGVDVNKDKLIMKVAVYEAPTSRERCAKCDFDSNVCRYECFVFDVTEENRAYFKLIDNKG